MAEVHFIGNILEATDFSDESSLFARWTLNSGSCWRALEGYTQGQTQLATRSVKYKPSSIDQASEGEENLALRDEGKVICHSWSHPIDVHYITKGLQGWPKLEFQVWDVNWLGKCNICAYGFMNLPAKPGYHDMICSTWRPVGNLRRRFIDYLTGYRMHLVDPSDIVSNGLNRHLLQAISMGYIRVQLSVVLKDFEEHGVDI